MRDIGHIIYAVENPNKTLKLLKKLVPECMEGFASLKRRVTRPPSHRFNTDDMCDLLIKKNTFR